MYHVPVSPAASNICLVVALLLLSLSAFVGDRSVNAQLGSDCKLPDGAAGLCSSFAECPLLYDLATRTARPWPNEFVEYITGFHCGGFEDNLPRVCCTMSVTPEIPTRFNSPTLPPPPPTTVDQPLVIDRAPPPPTSMPAITTSAATNSPFIRNREDFESIEYVTNHANLRLLPLDTCGPIQTQKISNGNITDLFEYPWMALLQYETSSSRTNDLQLEFKCGGSLISARYILTAAHCVTNLEPGVRLASVRLGEHDLASTRDCQSEDGELYCAEPVQDIRVAESVAHSNYNRPFGANDVGLVRLARSANMIPESVRPVCLPISEKLQNLQLHRVSISGWGTTENQTQSQQLLQASMPIVSNEACQAFFKTAIRLQPAQLCAGGERGVDSCKGDSGGPLVYPAQVLYAQMVQFGIVSLGVNYCSSDNSFPGIYTRVSHYMKWILDNMND